MDQNTLRWDSFVDTIQPGSILDKIVGMIYGHALGDAMGLETKFKTKNSEHVVTFPTANIVRGFSPCDWSANTDHMIIIMQALIAGSLKIYPCDIAARLRIWASGGFKELGDTRGLGLSGHLSAVINHPKFLEDPYIAASDIWKSSKGGLNTNGSLARTSILGSIINPDQILNAAANVSSITHVDPKCQAACVFQSLVINYLIYNNQFTKELINIMVDKYIPIACQILNPEDVVLFEQFIGYGYTGIVSGLELDTMAGMSYVLKSLSVSAYALQVIAMSIENDRVPSFEKFILRIVSECGDTDTNAAVSGAIMGSYLGYSNLPKHLISAMPHHQWLNCIIIDYISTMMSAASTAAIANDKPPETNTSSGGF